MTKLPKNSRFLDLSDYARPFAVMLVKLLLPTKIGAYTITFTFLVIGLIANYLIYNNTYINVGAVLLLVKSMLDAADGEIARRRNTPSAVGRYMDSIFDFIINILLFISIYNLFPTQKLLVTISFLLFELQGSVYNYYYLIKRYQVNGDKTSRIIEWDRPKPFERDNPVILNIFHKLYIIMYGWQDYMIHRLDPNAVSTRELPSWFLTAVSLLGLGSQLLIISIMLILNLHEYIFIFFMFPYSFLAASLIIIRRLFIR